MTLTITVDDQGDNGADLEYSLGETQTDRRNLHVNGPPCALSTAITPWHFDTGTGRRPPRQ